MTNKVQEGVDLVDSMTDQELNQLVDYIRVAYKTRAAARNAKAKAALEVGSRVRITGRTKPQYLSGLTAEVTGFGDSRVNIKLDCGPVGKFRSGTLKCPAGMLEVIS